jgi:FkbM family methyltransferase
MYRSFIYRLGRHLYSWARGDLPNKPETNGEYWLVKQAMARVAGNAVFLDVGANIGDWTATVIGHAEAIGLNVYVKAFEPFGETRKMLAARFADITAVEIYATAVSEHTGTAVLYANHAGSGTNSLHPVSGRQQEAIAVTTLDAFLGASGIAHVAFVKIDVEGFDALVLKGAINALKHGAIDLLQFEYNWRWILNSQSLKNVFQLIEELPYLFGKLSGDRILLFDSWHFEMDRFFENNYVLIRKGGPFEALGLRAYYDSANTLRY